MSKLAKALTAAAGNAGGDNLYVEDVFSTYLYEGNGFYPSGGGQTITNGIDLDGEGGMIWIKARNTDSSHGIYDTERGISQMLGSNLTAQEYTDNAMVSANSDGFTLGAESSGWTRINLNGYDYASWTFRKAEKFFDVVTYTGDGVNGRQLPHNLGSTPGMVVCKRTDTGQNWILQHRSLDLSGNKTMYLNLTDPLAVANDYWNSTHASDTAITLSGNADINGIGGTYVAYVFAHDAGGFGDDGDESIIKCGSFTTDGSGLATIDLGFEPQYFLTKNINSTQNWFIFDTMRGWTVSGETNGLLANDSSAEVNYSGGTDYFHPTATGAEFVSNFFGPNQSMIYIAIRRPMKTPESGTEVFNPTTAAVGTDITNNFAADLWFGNNTSGDGGSNAHTFASRLTGLKWLQTATTSAEFTASNSFYWDSNTEFTNSQFGGDRVEYFLKRATGFFDVVAYTSTTSAINHNLGVSPELVIYKPRTAGTWYVMAAVDGFAELNSSGAFVGTGNGSGLGPNLANATATTITGGGNLYGSTVPMVTYLFATLAGVSKVGSYTGTGSNVDVDCGFSAGARFILIKRTDSTGDWYVWDSARGIVAGNDPYLLLNSTAAEVTSTDYIDPLASGFTVTSSAPAALNASGGTYIFLAIA